MIRAWTGRKLPPPWRTTCYDRDPNPARGRTETPLTAALPTTVQIDSMPLGLDEPKALDIRPGGAVWLVYAGGKPDPGQDDQTGSSRKGWVWSCPDPGQGLPLQQASGSQRLDLLEAVDTTLDGAKIEFREVVGLGDKLLTLPKEKGLIGYEAQFRVEVFRDRK